MGKREIKKNKRLTIFLAKKIRPKTKIENTKNPVENTFASPRPLLFFSCCISYTRLHQAVSITCLLAPSVPPRYSLTQCLMHSSSEHRTFGARMRGLTRPRGSAERALGRQHQRNAWRIVWPHLLLDAGTASETCGLGDLCPPIRKPIM